jgi:hypothetical protein
MGITIKGMFYTGLAIMKKISLFLLVLGLCGSLRAEEPPVYFVACHGGPADHFATFAEELGRAGYEVRVCASGPALKKFQDRNIRVLIPFDAEKSSPEELARQIEKGAVVITDVGHPFAIDLQKRVSGLAYYDNPEADVPGGYSEVASRVMRAAKRVLFANGNLATAPRFQELQDRRAIGYYPVAQGEKLRVARKESGPAMRAKFFRFHNLQDHGEKVLVYFGGNNTTYFQEAFPAFLHALSEGEQHIDLSRFLIVFQQHPGAKASNIDRNMFEQWRRSRPNWRVVFSCWSSDEVQVAADGALYYQTSMGSLFALAGIPTLQVGHKTYEDLLVREGICPSVTNGVDFACAIEALKPAEISQEEIEKSLGIHKDWFERLKEAL